MARIDQKETSTRLIPNESSGKLSKDTILEHAIVRDLIYAMQGLPGQYFELIKDPTSGISTLCFRDSTRACL